LPLFCVFRPLDDIFIIKVIKIENRVVSVRYRRCSILFKEDDLVKTLNLQIKIKYIKDKFI